MKKTRIITITMDIDTDAHEGKMRCVITEDGKEKTEYTVSEALTIATTLGHVQQEILTDMRQQAVKEEFGL